MRIDPIRAFAAFGLVVCAVGLVFIGANLIERYTVGSCPERYGWDAKELCPKRWWPWL